MSTKSLFLGIDVGTSGLKVLAVDERGGVRAQASSSYDTLTPEPGWTEQRPEDWWMACGAAIRALATQVPLDGVAAIGLTGQMHGSVFLDAEREVIRPALLWNDQRTVAEAAFIEEQVGVENLIRVTGNRAFTGFTAPKVLWLRRHAPISYKLLHHLLLPKDYVRLRLTGELATDAGDASGVGLLDVAARRWSAELCDALEIDERMLPEVYEGSAVTGTLQPRVASELGLPPGVPVVAGGGDQQTGAIGAGATLPGVAMCSLGTSGVVFTPADTYRFEPQGRLHAMCHAVPGAWHMMGVSLSGGGALQWLADALTPLVGKESILQRLDTLAATSAPGADGLLFLPHLSGERMPRNDPGATAAFLGLASRHGIGDMARAVMEGVAYNLREIVEITRAAGGAVDEVRLIGGGAQSAVWPRIIADVFGVPVRLLASDEGTALGAALLAMAGAGAYATVNEAAEACVRARETVAPRPEFTSVYEEGYRGFKQACGATRESA